MNKEEIIELLETENFSSEYYELLRKADMMTRQEFNNKGYIFAQIGLNGGRCEGNCKFCSMAKKYYSLGEEFEKTEDEIVEQIKGLSAEKVDDIFLMTTVGYNMDKFMRIGKKAREILGKDTRLVANISDFNYETAQRLKESGYTGVYHIRRLREGIDTEISPETRLRSIENAQKAGLEIYYCIEPIGPEHSYEEIAEEILFAESLNVGAMAVMRRTAVPGTKLYERGQISKAEILKIGAVTRILTHPTRSMNIHETVETSLICGVNQLYAEYGSNPRDKVSDTSTNRGLTVSQVKNLFDEYNLTYRH